jgi:hypothetical protein
VNLLLGKKIAQTMLMEKPADCHRDEDDIVQAMENEKNNPRPDKNVFTNKILMDSILMFINFPFFLLFPIWVDHGIERV